MAGFNIITTPANATAVQNGSTNYIVAVTSIALPSRSFVSQPSLALAILGLANNVPDCLS